MGCNPSKKRKLVKEELQFCTLKCKCEVQRGSIQIEYRSTSGTWSFQENDKFFRLFCLERGEAPCINLSIVKECKNRVCSRDCRGAKSKYTGLGVKLDLDTELQHNISISHRVQRKKLLEATPCPTDFEYYLIGCKDTLQVETATIRRGNIRLRQIHRGQTRGVGILDEVPTVEVSSHKHG